MKLYLSLLWNTFAVIGMVGFLGIVVESFN